MEGLFQPLHLFIILLIVVVLFGGRKLPELGKGLGEAIRGFKSAMREGDSDNDRRDPPPPTIGGPKSN